MHLRKNGYKEQALPKFRMLKDKPDEGMAIKGHLYMLSNDWTY